MWTQDIKFVWLLSGLDSVLVLSEELKETNWLNVIEQEGKFRGAIRF